MDAFTQLRGFLENRPPRSDKAPYRFDQNLKDATKATTDNVQTVLLKAGFQAWFAYFAADSKIRTIVDKLSPADVSDIAQKLCEVELHEDIKTLFRYLFDGAARGNTRYRKLKPLTIERKQTPK